MWKSEQSVAGGIGKRKLEALAVLTAIAIERPIYAIEIE
jgi:hypothetical protein